MNRHPKDVRPIALKQVANNIVLGATNWVTKKARSDWTHPAQRGFLCGRQFTQGIVAADCQARALGARHPSAAAVALDLQAAFPSIARNWIERCLVTTNLPLGYRQLVSASHRQTWALARGNGEGGCTFSYPIDSGVLQGCTLASSLFIITFDPVIRLISTALAAGGSSKGFLHACADDLLILMKSVTFLKLTAKIFNLVRRATRLQLNGGKCNIVPWPRKSTTPLSPASAPSSPPPTASGTTHPSSASPRT